MLYQLASSNFHTLHNTTLLHWSQPHMQILKVDAHGCEYYLQTSMSDTGNVKS